MRLLAAFKRAFRQEISMHASRETREWFAPCKPKHAPLAMLGIRTMLGTVSVRPQLDEWGHDMLAHALLHMRGTRAMAHHEAFARGHA